MTRLVVRRDGFSCLNSSSAASSVTSKTSKSVESDRNSLPRFT